ncbi:MAG: Zn-ribbon domain-containing OB-fold protein [Dehalococcoidia bacterium]
MAEAKAQEAETRPIVPFLRLGETRDEDYLFASKCKKCNALYTGTRRYCGSCSSDGPFDEVRLSKEGEVHVWSIINQATPYVKAPYAVGIIDLPEGIAVNSNIEIEPKPENLKFGMKVKMYTEKISEDREGNSYIAYRFRPA